MERPHILGKQKFKTSLFNNLHVDMLKQEQYAAAINLKIDLNLLSSLNFPSQKSN